MATRMTPVHEMAARIRALKEYGFVVGTPRGLRGAYRVTCPDGHRVEMHLTASDVNQMRVIERELNKHGLREAEAKRAADREAAKEAKLAAQRRAAEEAAERLIKQSAMVARAAGHFLVPEHVDADWYLEKHPAPWCRAVIMTPELAAELLEKTNTNNRPQNEETVRRYEAVILSGQWRLTHQAIAWDANGVLQDGQHRLAAVGRAGVDLPMMAFVGMDPGNFKAIDEGRLRSVADLLARSGEGYASVKASITKLIVAYRSENPRHTANRVRLPNEAVYDTYYDNAEALHEASRWAMTNYRKCKLTPAPLGAAYALIRETNGADNPYVEAFFTGLATGQKAGTRVVLDDDDPRRRLRSYMYNRREKRQPVAGIDQLILVLNAWNYVVEDYRPRFFRNADDMAIPKIHECLPGASACPPLLADEVRDILDARAAAAAAEAEAA